METWIVSELFYPEDVSTGYIITKIAEELAEETEVNVICGPSTNKSDVFKASYEISSSIKIHRVNIPKLDMNKILSRVTRMILLTLKMGCKLAAKVKKGDKVIIVTNPPSLLVFISLLRIVKKFNYIILVHDLFPENLVPAGIVKKTSFFYKALLKVFTFSYNKASKVIAPGRDMQALIADKLSKEVRTTTIANWADVEDIYPIRDINISKYYDNHFEGKIILQFAGNIGRVQGLEDFFHLMHQVVNPAIIVVIIGEGALKNNLLKLKQSLGLENIFFYSAKPRSEQLYFLNACHLGLITLSQGMYGLGAPSKTFNILAAGKPILFIGDKDAEVSKYIEEGNTGWAFTWDEKEKIISFLSDLSWNDLAMLEIIGKNARQLVETKYTKEKILKQYIEE
ncbi:MAG: glycosyltransferase WbuB, partial [Sediminibacterium sp.]|nr:glycosyltransferase WbuB [Sediminibacterium sp.]